MAKARTKIAFHGIKDLPPMAMSLRSMGANLTGAWRNIRPMVDGDKCTGCMICWKFCPDLAIDINTDKERPIINLDYCKGCGICAEECPKKCITMVEEEK